MVAAEWERLFDLNLRAKNRPGYVLEKAKKVDLVH
jgi:hypothetical protein